MPKNEPKGKESVQVIISLSGTALARLRALQAKTESDEQHVFANAVRLYEAVVGEAEAGAEFFIRRKGDESPQPYEVFKGSDTP